MKRKPTHRTRFREILLRMEQNRKNVQTAVIVIAIVLCVLVAGAVVLYKKGDCATKRRLQERSRGYAFYDAYSSDADRGLCISLGE